MNKSTSNTSNQRKNNSNRDQRRITFLGRQEQWRLDNEKRKVLIIKTKREISAVNAIFVAIVTLVIFIMLIGIPGIAIGLILGGLSFWLTTTGISNKIPNKIIAVLTSRLKPITSYNLSSSQIARTQNLVDGICQKEGVDIPQRLVYDDPSINSLLLVFSKKTCIILTKGAVELLNRIELEAIIAYQIGRLKSNICSIQLLSVTANKLAKYLIYLRPIAEKLNISFGIDPELEALRITKYPPGLIEVFRKSKQEPPISLPSEFSSEYGCLWMIQPELLDLNCDLSVDSKIDLLLDL
jgi:hypothetical protein